MHSVLEARTLFYSIMEAKSRLYSVMEARTLFHNVLYQVVELVGGESVVNGAYPV